MKRLFTTLTILMASIATLHAQEIANDNTIILDKTGENRITIINEDTIKFRIAGREFQMSTEPEVKAQQEEKKRHSTIPSLGFIELGINSIYNADYSMYSPEDAEKMQFGNNKSSYVTLYAYTENFRLNKQGSLSIDMGLGITWENYVFAGDYSMRYIDGMMRPIDLESSVTKSKLMAVYYHMPMLLNWTYKNKFFIAAGVNLDVLIATRLKQKNPKIVNDSENVTLEPIQLGSTIRVGTKSLYGFLNWSHMQMFKTKTGPGGHRISAGIGLNF
ncbi:MAG: hypothetical protein J6U93_02375 [Alistipes sp.]|nr:hypothetical protein [Alistipes sp.]